MGLYVVCKLAVNLSFLIKGGGGPTLLMSVHPLILAKCSQNRQTNIDKNRQKYICLRFEGSWMLIIDVCSFKMVCNIGYDWECF